MPQLGAVGQLIPRLLECLRDVERGLKEQAIRPLDGEPRLIRETAPLKSHASLNSSPGWWYRRAVYSSFCCFDHSGVRPTNSSPSPMLTEGTPALANEKWSDR